MPERWTFLTACAGSKMGADPQSCSFGRAWALRKAL
jgi:hypothetical protein